MSSSKQAGWGHTARRIALPLGAVVVVSLLGQAATFPNLPWYAGLVQPSFSPPNWLFGPVWTALYGLMAYAAFRILRLAASPVQGTALVLFWAQLALNAAWSWMFFAAQSPLFGLINIVPQFLLVAATAMAFAQLDRIAGLCLLPLVGWVSFATALNGAVWWLNR